MENVLSLLESGRVRSVVRAEDGSYSPNVEVKQAILSTFRSGKNVDLSVPTEGLYTGFVDKDNLLPRRFNVSDGVRMVPGGTSVRRGAYVAPGVTLMPPSYVNVGAYIDEGTMVDSHVLVGSCAQIGKRVHLSAGVQIGGVLEPVGLIPVVIEDDAFIGAGAVIVEGIRVSRRAVIAPSVVLSRGVNLYDAVNERELERGSAVPEGAVVVPGTRPLRGDWASSRGLAVGCAVIVKYRDDRSDSALTLEEALR